MTLGPTEVLTKDNVKVRWGERYTSDALNKKFLGIPRGIYLGFVPSASGLVLTLNPDRAVTLTSASTTPFAINDVITGGTTATNAVVYAISNGFLLIGTPSGGTGSFAAGETITAVPSGASGVVGAYTNEAISFARTVSSTPLVPGRSEDMVDLITGDPVTLDFTGFNDGTYFVYATGAYSVGAVTTGTLSSRTAPPPNGTSEVLTCEVTKLGLALTIQASSASTPPTRQEPFATAGSRIGFMPGGAINSLLAAVATTDEVVASRIDISGTTATTFNPAESETTGLPARLASDLSQAGSASRLGKLLNIVQGNDYDPTVTTPISNVALTGTASPVYNISGSFAGRIRDHQPFRDETNGTIPAQTLTLSPLVGTFLVGETVTGANGSTAIIQSLTISTITIYNIIGYGFTVGEVIEGNTSAATGTITISAGGVRVPVVIDPNSSDVVTLTLSAGFAVGTTLTGDASRAQGVVRAATGTTVDLDQLLGLFRINETVNVGAATVNVISQRIGAVTAQAGQAINTITANGDAEHNIVSIRETQAGHKPVDSNGNPIYGRTLFGPNGVAAPGGGGPGELLVATGAGQQLNFVNGSTIVTNNSLDFTQYFLPGDIIEGADGRFYEVSPTWTPSMSSLSLTTGKPYLGPNASAGLGVGPGPRRRRRYLLELVSLATGLETAQTLSQGVNIPSLALFRPFFPCWFTEEQTNYTGLFAREAPGDGIFLANPNGSDTTPGHIVQTNDVRLAKITAELGGAGQTGLEPIVNFIQGSGITITVIEGGGKINVTITNSSPGGGGPSPGSNIQSVVPGGSNSGGVDVAYARDDHVHAAPAYPAPPFVSAAVDPNTAHTSTFNISCANPRLVVVAYSTTGPIYGFGMGAWDGSSVAQGGFAVGVGNDGSTTQIITTTNGNWTVAFNSTQITMTPSGSNSFQMSTGVIGGG
jgi:hypothetical protein